MNISQPSGLSKKHPDESLAAGYIASAKKGDKAAFEWLVNHYRNQMAGVAFKMTGDYETAQDITQEVFLKVKKSLWRYDQRKRFFTWIYKITVNATIDYLRRKKRQPRYQDEPWDGAFDDIESPDGNPETLLAEKELLFFISAAADRLPDKQHTAFQLREMDGWPITNVAAFLGIPEATVRWHIHRARLSIRKYLANQAPHLLSQFGIKSR